MGLARRILQRFKSFGERKRRKKLIKQEVSALKRIGKQREREWA